MIVFNGSTGGLGQYMAASLQRAGLDYAVLRSRLADTEGLKKELDEYLAIRKPPARLTLIQLAGLVPVSYCEEHPEEAFQTNVTDTRTMVSAFLQWGEHHGITCRILYISTGHVYRKTDVAVRLTEDHPVGPRSVYAKSKWEAEKAIASLADSMHAPYLIVRTFGLLSPRQSANYVLPGLIRRVKEGRYSDIPGLRHIRDYLDARDICAHLASLAAQEWGWLNSSIHVLNLCSGEPTSIEELLLTVIHASGGDESGERNKFREAVVRPDDIPWLVGDPQKWIQLTGRTPRLISLKQTAQDAFNEKRGAIP